MLSHELQGQQRSYDKCAEEEKARYKDFVRLKEYKHYYLCGRLRDGKLLYKECFSKFDIDGVEPTYRDRDPYDTKHAL